MFHQNSRKKVSQFCKRLKKDQIIVYITKVELLSIILNQQIKTIKIEIKRFKMNDFYNLRDISQEKSNFLSITSLATKLIQINKQAQQQNKVYNQITATLVFHNYYKLKPKIPSNNLFFQMKFYLLHSDNKSKWHKYLVQQLIEQNLFYVELNSIKETLNHYFEDEENSFIFIDIICNFTSYELQALRGTKSYCTIQCKFELQKTKEKIVGQRVKEICIKGPSIFKCISMFSFLTDFDPMVEVKSIAQDHVNVRLGCSEAYVHFEIIDPSTQLQSFRYCINTDTESLCLVIFNDNPFQKMVFDEINAFIQDKLNIRENIQENEYLNKMIYLKRMGELCQEVIEKQSGAIIKPVFLTKVIYDTHLNKLRSINQEYTQQIKSDIVDFRNVFTAECISDSKSTSDQISTEKINYKDSKLEFLFGDKVQFCTTGTAAINQEALFEPLRKIQNAFLSSFYTTSVSKGKPLYFQNISEGVKYFSRLQDIVNQFNGVTYVPSLPGRRKEDEILNFISSKSKPGLSRNIVLAEKPAFANYNSAQNFLSKTQKIYEAQKQQEFAQRMSSQIKNNIEDRVFFGWHYIHHPAIQEVITRIQDGNEFGYIKKIKAHFVRPKPYSTNGRIFDPKQGGCGLDRFCYPLHLALTLSKYQVSMNESAHESSFTSQLNRQQSFQILEASHLNYNEIYNQDKPEFENLEGRLESKLIINQQIEVDLYSSMETHESFFSEASILFENGTEIKLTWFIHPHVQFKDFKLYCASIKLPNKKSFEPFIYKNKFDKTMSSYDYQIQQMIKLKNGTVNYDTVEDRFNLCTESNVYLHLVLDSIFTHSGLKIKEGM